MRRFRRSSAGHWRELARDGERAGSPTRLPKGEPARHNTPAWSSRASSGTRRCQASGTLRRLKAETVSERATAARRRHGPLTRQSREASSLARHQRPVPSEAVTTPSYDATPGLDSGGLHPRPLNASRRRDAVQTACSSSLLREHQAPLPEGQVPPAFELGESPVLPANAMALESEVDQPEQLQADEEDRQTSRRQVAPARRFTPVAGLQCQARSQRPRLSARIAALAT